MLAIGSQCHSTSHLGHSDNYIGSYKGLSRGLLQRAKGFISHSYNIYLCYSKVATIYMYRSTYFNNIKFINSIYVWYSLNNLCWYFSSYYLIIV